MLPEYSWWIIAGLLLIIAEFMVSGLVVVFFGVAALLVGALKFFGLIDGLAWELSLFAVFSVLMLFFVRRFLRDQFMGRESDDAVAADAAGLIGARAEVIERFEDGIGLVSYRGARWQASSRALLMPGDQVRITEHDGIWLTVEPWPQR